MRHETLWQHSMHLHHGDTQTPARSGNRQKVHHLDFSHQAGLLFSGMFWYQSFLVFATPGIVLLLKY